MKKDFNILPLVFALAILSFSACGVKKNATVEVNAAKATQPATTEQAETATEMSLAQRVASGEFAWLDTIQVDTTSACSKSIFGHYILYYQDGFYRQRIGDNSNITDSLILTSNGYYYRYKKDSLVEYGRYMVRNHCNFQLCIEQYKVDWDTGTVTNEIERVEKEEKGILMDFYNYNNDYHCYWVTYSHHPNPSWKELTLILDIHNDCLKFHNESGNSEIKWATKH
ncbi:MAG: hypothetical protein II928_01595 [Paludibacteraceae bacterium]|nr:hypothetical protein [Paludibacteraceae bacterium]